MELIQLLSFHQIVETGSFSKASSNIFRSQSAVSHQIKNLEKELFGKTEYGIYFRKNKYITTAMKQFIKFFAPELFDNLPSYEAQ